MAPHIELIARGVLLRDGKVLLCQNTSLGYWYLPGGHVEFGEAAAVALAREFQEECGLVVAPGPCVLVTEGCFEAGRVHHEINLVFHVEAAAMENIRSLEAGVAFRWFDLASLLEVDVRPAAVKAWLMTGGTPEVPGCAWVSEIGSG